MKPEKLFDLIWNIEYNKSGFDVDWRVMIFTGENKIRLFFKPSTTVKDWIVNIAGFLPIYKFPLFYTMGWKLAFDSVKEQIMEELIRTINMHKNCSVEICGHSYGGAMSIDAGIELYKRTRIKADIVTFGAPRPLFLLITKYVSRLFLGNVKQYEHRSDIVTFCPPLIGYHNVKSIKVGKFSFKKLFNPSETHMGYDDESLY